MKKHRKKGITMTEAAKRAGLFKLTCQKCGSTIKAFDALKAFLRIIIEECRLGKSVRLTGFGTFSQKIWRGRTVEGIECKDRKVLSFRQTPTTRSLMNKEG